MPPTATSLPATPPDTRRPDETDLPPDRGPGRRTPWPFPLAARFGAVLALLLVLLAVGAVGTFGQLEQLGRDQDAILSTEVRHGETARRMQVEFERQGREWRTVLLQGSDASALSTGTQRFRDRMAAVTALSDELEDQVVDPAAGRELLAFRIENQALNAAYDDALASFAAAGGRNPATPAAAVADRERAPSSRLDALVERLDAATAVARAAQHADLAHRQAVLRVLGLVVVLLVLGAAAGVVLGVVRPIRRLAHGAGHAVSTALPAALARIRTAPPEDAPPVLAPVRVGTGDELEELGRALTAMQTAVLDAAVQQHRVECEAAQTLINLGRRNQNLVEYTLACLGDLTGGPQDPAVAARLVQLRRTTSRMRRSAESMLVLGGTTTQARIWSRPVPVAEIVRAALAEIEDDGRVDLHHVEETAVVGTAVADLTHLTAELLENATNFSPPNVRVTVVGQFTADGRYGLHVVDQGIGMTSPELAEANARIGRAASSSNPDTHRLGLHVVGRLAARLGVQVTLRPSTGRGVTAHVGLPPGVIIDLERTDPGPAGRTPARRTAERPAGPGGPGAVGTVTPPSGALRAGGPDPGA